jgi:hypothetical protein
MKMPSKARIYLAALAAIAVAVPTGFVVAGGPAAASTATCGSSCTSPSVESLGTGEVLAVSGLSVAMSAASSTNSAEDWTPEQEGDVANAVSAGVISAKLNMLYSTDQVVEYQYAPDGVPSDDCLAASTPSEESGSSTATLAACGLTSMTLWIVDASNEANGYVDLVSAGYTAPPNLDQTAVTPFAEPGVLSVSSGKVVLSPLSEIGGVVSHSQMWANWSAPAQAGLRHTVAKAR